MTFSSPEDRDLLRLMYDAQLKKMLAYIAAAISSFAAQLAMFLLVVGRSITLPVLPTVTLAILLWLAQCYFAVAVVTIMGRAQAPDFWSWSKRALAA